MNIKLSPQRRDEKLTASKQGDRLTINGVEYDFTDLPDGATLPVDTIDCEYIRGDVERIEGQLHLTLILPHGPNAPHETRFPEPIVDPADGPADGPLLLPPYGGAS